MNEQTRQPIEDHPAHAESAADVRNPDVSHEKSGFDFSLIAWVGLALIAAVGLVQASVWWLLVGYEEPHAPPALAESSLALASAREPLAQRLRDVPPPHLDGLERDRGSIAAARQRAEALLDSFGWADRQKEVARIPIALAMEEVLKSKEFRSEKSKNGAGRDAPLSRANSGRKATGGRP
jgi:hypothetical protein